jgi:hypothetical protein
MVRGLVEQKEVGFLGQYDAQVEPAPFPSRFSAAKLFTSTSKDSASRNKTPAVTGR